MGYILSKHLLVVEDSAPIAKVIESMGRSLGYQVTIASTLAGVRAILAKKQDFFVATIDYGLPDANDGEAIPYVLQHKIPSIVMTGRVDDKTRQKILNLPVIDYITKENSQAYHYLLRVLHYQLTNAKVTVLVVDDSLTARNNICSLLKRRNFKVLSADNGARALKVLNDHPEIKMVITDQEMPGMDGIELIQNIRKNHLKNELIIIGISGANRGFQSARFIKNGADDFLRKPFCPEEFYCRIMHNIEKIQYLDDVKIAESKDYLTTLFNRRSFVEQADNIHSKVSTSKYLNVLALIRIDSFKEINENISHEMGDNVLIELAKLLSLHFKKDLVSRFGGGEFGILINGQDEASIEKRIEYLRLAVQKHITIAQKVEHQFTVSIGTTMMNDNESLQYLLKEADQALHQAIEKGGNQSVIKGFIELG